MVDINNITEKSEILFALAPFSEGMKALKRKSDLVDFTYTDLRLYGSTLTKEGVASILDGITIPGAPVLEHRLCEAHRKLLNRFDDKLHMGLEIDSILLNEFCVILASSELPPYREGAPLLYHLDYVPGCEDSISADLAGIFNAVRRAENEGVYSGDFCLKAADIHMGILKVYPYIEGFSELSARAAAQFELVRAGYFPVDYNVSEPEYNRICADAIRTSDVSEFADVLRMAVLKKLHKLIDAVNIGT